MVWLELVEPLEAQEVHGIQEALGLVEHGILTQEILVLVEALVQCRGRGAPVVVVCPGMVVPQVEAPLPD